MPEKKEKTISNTQKNVAQTENYEDKVCSTSGGWMRKWL